MGVRRLLKSIAWKLLPYGDLDFDLASGLRLPLRDKGEWACLGEVFVNRVYDDFFRQLGAVRGWVDLGCNVGFFSLGLEHYLRSSGSPPPTRALLIDANEHCVALAGENLRRNGLGGWVARHAVLGPAGQTVTFHQFKYSIHSGIFSQQRGEKVKHYPTTPLATLLQQHEVPRDLIKIDIEGAEKNLFADEGRLIREFRAGICEWHAPEMPGRELERFLRAAGCEIFFLKSQPVDWDMKRGDSVESPVGMLGWRNPAA
jgi:FkbM family methyltransferase